MAAPPLLRAPVLIVPKRAAWLVRKLAEDAASPVTAPDGTVLGRVRQEPPPPAPARALFLVASAVLGSGLDPTFAVEDPEGSPVLRLVFDGGEVRVHDPTQTEIGVLRNEGSARGRDVVVRMYGPARPGSRWSLRDPHGPPMAEGTAPYGQAPALTVIDAAGSTVARAARVGESRVSTEILTESLPLRTILAGLACSLVRPEWVNRPKDQPMA